MIQDRFTDAYSKQGNRDKVSSWLPIFQDLDKSYAQHYNSFKFQFTKPIKNHLTWVISEIWLNELLPKKM